MFLGEFNQPEEAREWLELFQHKASDAAWDNKKICDAFRMRTQKGARHWFLALQTKTQRNWILLKEAFEQHFCKKRLVGTPEALPSTLQFQSPASYRSIRRRPACSLANHLLSRLQRLWLPRLQNWTIWWKR